MTPRKLPVVRRYCFTAPLQAAIRSLGGAKLCAEGYEDGLVTHLVVGAERRTVKVTRSRGGGDGTENPQPSG